LTSDIDGELCDETSTFHGNLNKEVMIDMTTIADRRTFGRSSLPEQGLLFATRMAFLGLVVKPKVTPRWMRRFTYLLHTSSAAFSVLILLLVVGHLTVD